AARIAASRRSTRACPAGSMAPPQCRLILHENRRQAALSMWPLSVCHPYATIEAYTLLAGREWFFPAIDYWFPLIPCYGGLSLFSGGGNSLLRWPQTVVFVALSM